MHVGAYLAWDGLLYCGDPNYVRGWSDFCAAGPRPGEALAKFSPAWGQSRARRGEVLGVRPNNSAVVAWLHNLHNSLN